LAPEHLPHLPSAFREKALSRPEGLPEFVNQLLLAIEALNQQIARADQELKVMAMSDPVCERLMSVPGVGPVTAIRFVAAIDDVKRSVQSHSRTRARSDRWWRWKLEATRPSRVVVTRRGTALRHALGTLSRRVALLPASRPRRRGRRILCHVRRDQERSQNAAVVVAGFAHSLHREQLARVPAAKYCGSADPPSAYRATRCADRCPR
jgi:transposase